MAEMQTSGDINGQLARKAIGYGAGFAAGVAVARGVITQDFVDQMVIIVPVIIAAIGDFAWWRTAQKSVATVAGLKESNVPGTTTAAAMLEKVIRVSKTEGDSVG